MTVSADIQAIGLKQATNIAFLRSALLVGTLLLGLIQWYALSQLDILVQQGRTVAAHDQRLAVLEVEVSNMQAICLTAQVTQNTGPHNR